VAIRTLDSDIPGVTVSDSSSLSGRTVSHFRVLEPLGTGGMGVVYRAEDVTLGRTVALKFMLPDYSIDEAATARFLREARSVATLDHPNICTVHEAGKSEDGHLFLAMSYYAGETLKDRLTASGALPADQALDIAGQIARGLACAHAAGIVHRDLKPANVMLTAGGTVKILDFGLAKSRDQTMTTSGVVVGTIAYMAPEQLLGQTVDGRADLWALGVMLVEMLTGKHPAGTDHTPEALARRIEARHRVTMTPPVITALTQLVERLTRRDPEERYQDAADAVADLDAIRDRMADARARAPVSRALRKRLALGLAGTVVVVAGAVGVLRWTANARSAGRQAYSLAVLPLKNYAGTDQEYFADGMTDELTSTLTKIEGLHVIAHQSVLQFKGSTLSAPAIAESLNVKYLLDGSARQESSIVRITASLIDAERNRQVWSRTFEDDQRDVVRLQQRIALAITQGIAVTLTPADRTRLAPVHAHTPEVFELYLKGTLARHKANTTGDFREAIRYLTEAVEKDSVYAAAYAGLASVYLGTNDTTRARTFANKALALDSMLAEGQMVYGLIRQFLDWDLAGADSAFREAIRLKPGFAEAHHERSMLLSRLKQFDESLEEGREALASAPTITRFINGIGEVLVFSDDSVKYAEALAIANRLLSMDSTNVSAAGLRAFAYEQQGRWDDAARAWAACSRAGCFGARARIGYIYARTGRTREATEILNTLKAGVDPRDRSGTQGDVALNLATVYMGLGERAQAVTWLERAAELRSGFILYLAIDPTFKPLHGEPRFQALLKRIGLPN
jgi:eukaryotic-like serine/threonine-protein kinase